MELYAVGYKIPEILEETGDVLKKIDLSDTDTCQKLTKLFVNAKGRRRKDAIKEGRVPLVAKLLLMEVGTDNISNSIILFDERNTIDKKDKVSIPGGHVEDLDIEMIPESDIWFHNILHATIFREVIEEMEGVLSFDAVQRYVFQESYSGAFMSILPGLISRYGIACNLVVGAQNVYYQLTREYEPQTGVPFLIFYVPVYIYSEECPVCQHTSGNAEWYRKHCMISFSRQDYNFIDHIKRSSNHPEDCFFSEFGAPAKDDIRLVSDNKPKSRMLPAIFNTEELWNPIK